MSYKTAAALDVVLLLHHHSAVAAVVGQMCTDKGVDHSTSQQHNHLPLTADNHLISLFVMITGSLLGSLYPCIIIMMTSDDD